MPNQVQGLHLLHIDQGIPWAVAPQPRAFVLPDDGRDFHGLVLPAGTPFECADSHRLGTGQTRAVAAGMNGTGDVVVIGAKVRYRIAGSKLEDTNLHEICAANDAEMKRNGVRLLEIIADAVRRASDEGCTKRLQAVVRAFPSVALRHPRVAGALDRHPDPDHAIRRWFGLKAGRGRPARPVPEARTKVATIMHECDEAESITEALQRLARTGMGNPDVLAGFRSREGELYQLSIGGIWVKADRLRELPWVAPRTAEMRWDVYKVPA